MVIIKDKEHLKRIERTNLDRKTTNNFESVAFRECSGEFRKKKINVRDKGFKGLDDGNNRPLTNW